jgi:hypothetical protein
MEIKSIDRLSEELLKEFGDRKQKGRLDLVYDVGSGNYYAVPKGVEHAEFMPQIEGNPKSLIPVQLRYKENGKMVVTALLIGASSFEAEKGVRHPPANLKKAYDEALILLYKNNFEVSHQARLEIMQKFAERS